MESFTEAWSLVSDYCKSHITDVAYKAWISRIEPVSIDFNAGEAVILTPTEFHKQTLTRCYLPLLNNAFEEIFGPGIQIHFSTPAERSACAPVQTKPPTGNLEYELSFDNYIVGPSNKFAHAAAQAVANNPAGSYNPLFIYGNSGLGKTHLLYAICAEIHKSYPGMSTLYIKGDEFTNELIESIRKNTTTEFHRKYRKPDVLLVDDIQFIAGKDSTQEEFFHTFNTLYEAKKQIILTSDRPPKEIQTLEDRLRTRFEWGLIADIQPPDFETRIAIIKRKAELLDLNLPDVVAEFVATRLKSNIRQLEGVVKKIKAYNILTLDPPTVSIATISISDILNNDQPAPITVQKITEEVARTFGITSEDIRSSKRSAKISMARQAAIYVSREITQMPMSEIGKEFGGRDHSTVVYALQQIEKLLKKDSKFKATIEDIIKNTRDG